MTPKYTHTFFQMNGKKAAWIVTGLLVLALLAWVLVAVHDSAVAKARAARANSKESGGACPFSKSPSTPADSSFFKKKQ